MNTKVKIELYKKITCYDCNKQSYISLNISNSNFYINLCKNCIIHQSELIFIDEENSLLNDKRLYCYVSFKYNKLLELYLNEDLFEKISDSSLNFDKTK